MMRVEVLGTSFQIETDEDPAYLSQVLSYYQERVAEIEQTVTTGDPLKKAILAALLVTDELFRTRTETHAENADEAIGNATEELIRVIDHSLESLDDLD
jgi:cell division protein ZapA (FtsZ GTPase activity inhibitor)